MRGREAVTNSFASANLSCAHAHAGCRVLEIYFTAITLARRHLKPATSLYASAIKHSSQTTTAGVLHPSDVDGLGG